MKTEHVDREFGELLEKATPEMEAGWEARASVVMRADRPTARKPWGWAMAAAGLAALIGLGFVPVRTGEAPGVLARAVAAMEGASGLFVRSYRDGGATLVESWYAPGGYSRQERWRDGKLVNLSIDGPQAKVRYDSTSGVASVFDVPQGEEQRGLRFDKASLLSLQNAMIRAGGRVEQWRERSLYGGDRDVLEIAFEGSSPQHNRRYEIAPDSGRVVSYILSRLTDGEWESTNWSEEMIWGIEIPESLWEWEAPAGTDVTWYHWFEGRTEAVMAADRVGPWDVRLHHVDVDADGDLYLTLSRKLDSEWRLDGATCGTMDVAVIDNLGTVYELDTNLWGSCRGFRRYTVRRVARPATPIPVGAARTATITVYPDSESSSPDAAVFQDIALPPAQASRDLQADRAELIEY